MARTKKLCSGADRLMETLRKCKTEEDFEAAADLTDELVQAGQLTAAAADEIWDDMGDSTWWDPIAR